MISISISQAVWDAIAAKGKFGETPDDVLRRQFDLPQAVSTKPHDLESTGISLGGGQNRTTGRAGYEKGKSEAAKAAEYLGAEKVGKGNEYMLGDERVLIKWAKYRNGRIGIYDDPMSRADSIIGVLETSDGARELWKVAASVVGEHMDRSVVHSKQGQVNKSVLKDFGELIATLGDQ